MHSLSSIQNTNLCVTRSSLRSALKKAKDVLDSDHTLNTAYPATPLLQGIGLKGLCKMRVVRQHHLGKGDATLSRCIPSNKKAIVTLTASLCCIRRFAQCLKFWLRCTIRGMELACEMQFGHSQDLLCTELIFGLNKQQYHL